MNQIFGILVLLVVVVVVGVLMANSRSRSMIEKMDSMARVQDRIHILTNSGMRAALSATVVALKSDAVSKHKLYEMSQTDSDRAAALHADEAVREAVALVDLHDAQQPEPKKQEKLD